MQTIYKQRMTADLETDIVVFLIGMRINKWWKIHQWFPIILAMVRMRKELVANKALGLLGQENWFGRITISVQYWQSFEQLEHYATNRNAEHLPAWQEFNRKIKSSGDVGIWHETYLINKKQQESIYHNMPLFGLAKASSQMPVATSSESARQRLKTK